MLQSVGQSVTETTKSSVSILRFETTTNILFICVSYSSGSSSDLEALILKRIRCWWDCVCGLSHSLFGGWSSGSLLDISMSVCLSSYSYVCPSDGMWINVHKFIWILLCNVVFVVVLLPSPFFGYRKLWQIYFDSISGFFGGLLIRFCCHFCFWTWMFPLCCCCSIITFFLLINY